MITGKAIAFGNNIDTDQIIGAQYLTLPTITQMSEHLFEHHTQFTEHFTKGDIVVGGENFGCGSSREQAPAVLKECGVAAIVAASFARIFFRNAINLGIRLIECPAAAEISAGDRLAIDHDHLCNLTTGQEYPIEPLPDFLQAIVDRGGVIGRLQK
ncbi:MAG: 3-isopropylmalate dehydratase small subunit [Desulfoprunum sp.]|nr:3-isopropylmalate dehydratase small subunit [Desulfoprunum sp.]